MNVAARLEQFAEPGGICVSQTVYDQVRKIIEIPFQDIGERRLKNISDPVHVYRIAPEPLSWSRRFFSRANVLRRLGVAAGAVVLFLAVAAGSYYLRQPAALWDAVLGDSAELPEHPAIAVLPFDDMSPTHDQQYLADGITEDLITSLAKIPELLVMARTASFAYKDKPTDTRQVRKDLNVHYIVDGSIQRSDHDLRVTAQLIDAATGRELWAESYDRQIENIFAIRDDITRSIAGTLGGLSGKLAKAEVARLSAKDPNSFTAYDYLMRGWYEWHKFTPENNAAARDLFEQARQIDPGLCPRLCRPLLGLCQRLRLRVDEQLPQNSQAHARHGRARRCDSIPNDYQAHWALGMGLSVPPATRQGGGRICARAGAQSKRRGAHRGNGESAHIHRASRNRQSSTQRREFGSIRSTRTGTMEYLGWAYAEAGMPKEAIEVFQKAIDLRKSGRRPALVFSHHSGRLRRHAVGRHGRRAQDRRNATVHASRTTRSSDSVARSFPYKTQELVDKYVNAARAVGLPK